MSDFQPQGQAVLNQKINTLITDLQKIDKERSKTENIHIPLAVFDYIDQGKNPQLYTKDCIEKALFKNEETKGKIDTFRKFKNTMLVELAKEFPAEINKYRAIRKDEWMQTSLLIHACRRYRLIDNKVFIKVNSAFFDFWSLLMLYARFQFSGFRNSIQIFICLLILKR